MNRDRAKTTLRSIVAGAVALALATPAGLRPASAQTDGVDPPARVGRLAVIDHAVSMHRADETQWSPALVNYPVTSGLAFWADQGSRAEIGIGSAALRLGPQTELDIDRLDDKTAQIRLPQGSMNLTAPQLVAGESIDVDTPRGHLHIDHAGIYRFDAGTTEEPTRVVVFQGDATIASPTSSLDVHAGETGIISGTDPLSYSVDRAAVATALDQWATERSQLWHRNATPHVAASVTGYEDLDQYGSWGEDAGVGEVWYPRDVPTGWEPYRDGRWEWVDPWGWTWIDDQPWGFAPSHYGRWVRVEERWAWTPGPVAEAPIYAPAVVSFVGAALIAGAVLASEPVGWIPLGPRDVYYPHYRASENYARQINITNINQINIRNVEINRIDFARPGPGAPAENGRGFDPASLQNRRFATFAPPAAFGSGRAVTPVAAPAALTAALAAGQAPGPAERGPAERPGAPPSEAPAARLLQPAALPARRIEAPAAAPGPAVPAVGVAQTRFVRPLAAPGRAIPVQAQAPAAPAVPEARPETPAATAPAAPPANRPGEPLRPIEPERLRQPGPPAIAPPAEPPRPETVRPETVRPETAPPAAPAVTAPAAGQPTARPGEPAPRPVDPQRQPGPPAIVPPAEPARPETARPEPARPEPARPETAQPGIGQAETARPAAPPITPPAAGQPVARPGESALRPVEPQRQPGPPAITPPAEPARPPAPAAPAARPAEAAGRPAPPERSLAPQQPAAPASPAPATPVARPAAPGRAAAPARPPAAAPRPAAPAARPAAPPQPVMPAARPNPPPPAAPAAAAPPRAVAPPPPRVTAPAPPPRPAPAVPHPAAPPAPRPAPAPPPRPAAPPPAAHPAPPPHPGAKDPAHPG